MKQRQPQQERIPNLETTGSRHQYEAKRERFPIVSVPYRRG